MIALMRNGKVFEESDSDNAVMIVLEGQRPLDAAARRYYGELIDKLHADTKHVQHVQDFWGRSADRSRCAERRRQGRVRAGVTGRQHG